MGMDLVSCCIVRKAVEPRSDDDFRGEADQLGRICSDNAGIAGAPTIFNFDVATFAPPGFLKCLLECRDPTGCVRIACSEAHQYTNAPHPLRLLRACHERPRRRAAEQRDELAAPHVWMAPAWQEIIWRAAQKSLAVMCPACWCSPGGLLALMECANRGLITRAGSMSQ